MELNKILENLDCKIKDLKESLNHWDSGFNEKYFIETLCFLQNLRSALTFDDGDKKK